jgi:hypothetical protein
MRLENDDTISGFDCIILDIIQINRTFAFTESISKRQLIIMMENEVEYKAINVYTVSFVAMKLNEKQSVSNMAHSLIIAIKQKRMKQMRI